MERSILEIREKIKVLKGACAGCHNNNTYATVECILLEGFQGNSSGNLFILFRHLM